MSIKDILADIGIDTAKEFCSENNILEPTLTILRDDKDREFSFIKRVGTCGYYRTNEIKVAVLLCAHMNPNYSWAGFISDRTPYGVIQHELGHHYDEVRSGFNIYRNSGMAFSDKVRDKSKEKPITSYSPNTKEWFAEIFRLFVTNPVLLAMIRPKTYDILINEGLKPISDLSHGQVLRQFHAPNRVFERMENWIENKK